MKITDWKKTDKKLAKILNKTTRIYSYILDELNDLIPLYNQEDLYNYGNINKLKRYIQDNKMYLKGNILSITNNALRKTRMKNIDILEIYLLIIYSKHYNNLMHYEELEEIVQESYNTAYSEIKGENKAPKTDFKTLLDDWLYVYIPSLSANYEQYIVGRALSDAEETKRVILLQLQRENKEELKKTLIKQRNYFLAYNPKKKIQGIGGYSGAIDRLASYLVNKATLEGYKDAGVKQVRYIAVIDKHTTGVCRSLDLQVFNIEGENRFYRDDGYGDLKEYLTQGLENGVNLPPVVPPIHPCRSMIEYIKEW